MLQHSNNIILYSIHEIKHVIGETCSYILFLHAITGCDTVSSIYRQGKRKAFNLVHNKKQYLHLDTFTNTESTKEEVKAAGEQFILKLYDESLFGLMLLYYGHTFYFKDNFLKFLEHLGPFGGNKVLKKCQKKYVSYI